MCRHISTSKIGNACFFIVMAGSPIRAPLSNILFPQTEEKSPLMSSGTVRNAGSPIPGMPPRSPTYSRFPEGPFFNENASSTSPQPPMKKRCLDLPSEQEHIQQQQQPPPSSGLGDVTGSTQQVHDCSSDSLQTSSASLSPKVVSNLTRFMQL